MIYLCSYFKCIVCFLIIVLKCLMNKESNPYTIKCRLFKLVSDHSLYIF